MKINQVAAQLYTVRDYLKSPEDIAKSLKKIKNIGYTSVQISGMGPIQEESLVILMEKNGLTCCATHEPSDEILKEPRKVVQRLKKLNCKITAYPYPGNIKFDTLENVKSFSKKLNNSGKILSDNGIILTYHNHHIEFQKIKGKLILDIILSETNPKYIQAEIDTYWVQYGGGNPTEWCGKLKNRLPVLHMKDYQINSLRNIDFAEVGYGNLNWKSIIKSAEKSGCKWFIVEQDTCPGDPFESLKKSFDYIKDNLCN